MYKGKVYITGANSLVCILLLCLYEYKMNSVFKCSKAIGEYFYNVVGWNIGVKEGSFVGKMENPEA